MFFKPVEEDKEEFVVLDCMGRPFMRARPRLSTTTNLFQVSSQVSYRISVSNANRPDGTNVWQVVRVVDLGVFEAKNTSAGYGGGEKNKEETVVRSGPGKSRESGVE